MRLTAIAKVAEGLVAELGRDLQHVCSRGVEHIAAARSEPPEAVGGA